MKREELHRRLEKAGRADAPHVDAAFADALEARLRAVHTTLADGDARDAASAHPHAGPAPGRAWWRSPVPVAAATALLLVMSIGVLATQERAVRLASAYDAVVVYPDGRTVPARPGLELEEGAVIRIGASGHVIADGVSLGPGEAAVVTGDGDLRRVDPGRGSGPGTGAEPRPMPSRTAPDKPVPSERSAPDAKPSPANRPTPVTVVPPVDVITTASPQPQQERTAPPRPGATERDAPSTGGSDPVEQGQAEPDSTHALGLAAKRRPGMATLAWTATDNAHFGLYVVLRAPYPHTPEWPVREGSSTAQIGRTVERDHTTFTDNEPLERGVYRIVALDDWGREVGRSRAVLPDDVR